MNKKKFFKLLVLKVLVLLEYGAVSAFPAAGAYFMGFNPWWGFLVGVIGTAVLVVQDDREWKEKRILTFPLSTYLREPPQPKPPASKRHP